MGLSTCLIVGNVEGYLPRCLSSIRSFTDDLCVVRAIGSKEPDKSLDIAKEFGARVGEYRNHESRKDWPHVDDFAAARQQSFDMAENDFCMWIDSDDFFDGDADEIKRFVSLGQYPALMVPYVVTGRGVTPNRERVLNRKAGAWRYRVHECFQFRVESPTVAQAEQCRIIHAPEIARAGGNERNLRILESIPRPEMKTGLLFHLFTELILVKRLDEAAAIGEELFARPDLGKSERYEIILNMALLAKHSERRGIYGAALLADPTRREAPALLAGHALETGDNAEALAFARHMMATPKPPDAAWNTRLNFYGWIGDDIWRAALRANGYREEAEIHRQRKMKETPPAISLIHATRGRPQRAVETRKAWFDLAWNPDALEHVFCIDDDDPTASALASYHVSKTKGGGGCVRAWNYGALGSRGSVIVQMSDDFLPPMHWDKLILDEIEKAGGVGKEIVLQVGDGHRTDDLQTMAICTRTYFDKDFFLFHPDFTGVYSDNWFGELARSRGAVVDVRDRIQFFHDHPAFTSAPMDETYARQNSPDAYEKGQKTLERLRLGNDWSTVPGYFNYWPFYDSIAQGIPDGSDVCEVGCWLGRSSIYLAQRLKALGKHRVKIHVVDTFKGEAYVPEHAGVVAAHGGSIRAAFERNTERCGVAEMFTIHEGESHKMAPSVPDGLAFCWIDAAHDYESVKADLIAYGPKISQQGVFSGHDAQCDGVSRAVAECIKARTFGPIWVREMKK